VRSADPNLPKGIHAMSVESPLFRNGIDSEELKRYAFILKLRPGVEKAYDEAHASVPPELIALLKRVGVSEYSIFRRDRLLFLTLRTRNFESMWQEMQNDPANRRWQKRMGSFFEQPDDLRPGETFQMMEEVFYLP
jgi:L-rhamnose mutarotase